VDLTCSKTISFAKFSAEIVVTMGGDGRPAAIAVVMDKPSGSAERETAFNACAEAIVSLTTPDMTRDQRVELATKVVDADAARVGYDGWTFAAYTTPLRFRVFEAKRK